MVIQGMEAVERSGTAPLCSSTLILSTVGAFPLLCLDRAPTSLKIPWRVGLE